MTAAGQSPLFTLLREIGADSAHIADQARDRLLEAGLEPAGRAELITMLSRAGLSNVARLAVVETLAEIVEPGDAAAIARAIAKRHPSVVLAAIPVLESTQSAAALFAVRKPLRRGEPAVDAECDRAAARLAASVEVERYIRRDGVPGAGRERELAFAAAAASPQTLASIREMGADQALITQLGAGLRLLLEELSQRAQQASLSDFDARLRDELYEAVLLTHTPVDEAQQQRALENLFRRRDLDDVRNLAPHLPASVVARYAQRACSRAQRQSERADRAELALSIVQTAEASVRDRVRPVVLECLEEDNPALASAAIGVLARDADGLPLEVRQRIIRRFGSLPPDQQAALAPQLRGLAATAEEELDVESFLRWVDGAQDDEREARLGALKARWDSTLVSCEQAGAFVTTLARGVHRLPAADQHLWREELLEGSLSWLYRQGTQIVEPSRALLTWPGFAGLVLDDLDLALSLVRAEQARGLLLEVHRQADDPASVLADIARADVDADAARRVLVPVLNEAIRHDIRTAEAAFDRSEAMGQRRLLQSALAAANQTKRRIELLGRTTQDVADAAAAQHGESVLAALRDAEAASEGNDALERHLGSIRRAVESALAVEEAGGPPDAVVQWRLATAARHEAAVQAANDGRSPLQFRVEGPIESIGRVLLELDQRVHSTRVVSAQERAHLRHDLLRCVAQVVDAGLVDGPIAAGISSRPALGQLVWARWAERVSDPAMELGHVLGEPVDPRERQQMLLKVDALVARGTDDVLSEVVEAIPAGALRDAWTIVSAGLANRLRQAESLEQEVKSRGVELMERVAERLDPALRAIEGLTVGYYRLRRRLADAGWKPIEDTLGKELRFDQLDPNLHEIDGSSDAERFIVRSTGIRVRGRPVRRALVEPLHQGKAER